MIRSETTSSEMQVTDILHMVRTAPLSELFAVTDRTRREFRGDGVDLCSIVNARSGRCSEDCAYCAQSARYDTGVESYPLLPVEEITRRAEEARGWGARRFCIVTSGRKVASHDLEMICKAIQEIRNLGLLPCATLGILSREELQSLKEAGLERYHHNIETSQRFFPRICSTHSYEEKISTAEAVREVGLSLCSGGIFGLGESWDDRLEMALTLKSLNADSVPINFLIPVKGTPLGNRPPLNPLEALRIVSLFRLILPDREIRLCGGRAQTLREFNAMVFLAGADGLLVGNYLTTRGRQVEDDLWMINQAGLTIIP